MEPDPVTNSGAKQRWPFAVRVAVSVLGLIIAALGGAVAAVSVTVSSDSDAAFGWSDVEAARHAALGDGGSAHLQKRLDAVPMSQTVADPLAYQVLLWLTWNQTDRDQRQGFCWGLARDQERLVGEFTSGLGIPSGQVDAKLTAEVFTDACAAGG
jgi:hypothetical protein